MAAKLKVFVTSDGLTDYVVAATSRAKALAAWGSHQDLFKLGRAAETADAALTGPALAEPGVVLRRPAATRDQMARLKPMKPPPPAPAGPSPAVLRRIAALEARLADMDERHRVELDRLDAARAEAETRHAEARAALERDLRDLRRAPG